MDDDLYIKKYPRTRRAIAMRKFGQLTALAVSHMTPDRRTVWKCKCDCGNMTLVFVDNLINGSTKSCGCLQRVKGAARNTNTLFDAALVAIGLANQEPPLSEAKAIMAPSNHTWTHIYEFSDSLEMRVEYVDSDEEWVGWMHETREGFKLMCYIDEICPGLVQLLNRIVDNRKPHCPFCDEIWIGNLPCGHCGEPDIPDEFGNNFL